HSLPIPDPNSGYAVPGRFSASAGGSQPPDLGGVGGTAIAARSTSAGSRGGLIIGLAIGTFLLVGGVVGLLIWRPWASKAAPSEDLTKFLPDNSDFLASLDIKGLVASEAYNKIDKLATRMGGQGFRQVEEAMRREVGLGWTDLDRAM